MIGCSMLQPIIPGVVYCKLWWSSRFVVNPMRASVVISCKKLQPIIDQCFWC